MNLHEIQEKIIEALRIFIERDKNALLTAGVHEQAMSHRIAVYLEQPFS